ncbi:MAG: peptide chain release factor 1, partial [Candidatus Methanomethylophilus sp.]|nr:peptide chain release factor 1 [Methanomethylophilus sp.]
SANRARYDFKKAMEEIKNYRGRGTELISVYVPPGKLISDAMAYLRDEEGQAQNIKSKTTLKNVTSAIDSIMARLKTFNKVPEKGIVIFCGEVPRAGDQTKMVQYVIDPPEAITAFLYRCDSAFFTEPLDGMLVDKKFYGLLVMDRKEATIGMLAGTKIQVLKHFESMVPSKHHQGGQSSVRFERLIEIAAHEFFKKIADNCTTCFLDNLMDLEGIIIGGHSPTKDFFYNEQYLHHELQKKVIKPLIDTGYTDESGLKELVDNAQGSIADQQLSQEREMMQRLFREIRKTEGGLDAYGEDDVRHCAEMGAVDTFLISSQLRKYRCNCECSSGHTFDITIDDPEAPLKCPQCGANAKVLDSKDLIDDFFEMADTYNSNMQLITPDSEEGGMLLKAFGGIAALLRYRLE